MMAIKLSETLRMMEQQDKRAAEEQNDIGRGLFLKSQELLKKTTEVTEEAAIKLAASAYQGENQSGPSVSSNINQTQLEQEVVAPEQAKAEIKNLTALDMIKQGL